MAESKTFLVTYPFKGERYTAEIVAADWQEAEERLHALRYGKVDGELMFTIPVSPRGIWQRLKVVFS